MTRQAGGHLDDKPFEQSTEPRHRRMLSLNATSLTEDCQPIGTPLKSLKQGERISEQLVAILAGE